MRAGENRKLGGGKKVMVGVECDAEVSGVDMRRG